MSLSVLSALARQDVDPWTEAARLSQLPQATAAQQILGFLDALPRRTLDCLDRVEVAGRLCALLPRGPLSKPGSLSRPAPTGANPAVPSLNWYVVGIYICLMLLMNWLIAGMHPTQPAQAGAESPSSSVEAAPTAPPTSDASDEAAQDGH